MKIATTYCNDGTIFQHFGQTRLFKLYDVSENIVTETSILNSGEYSHGSLVDLLKQNSIDILICGGIGGGALDILNKSGIETFPGVSGDSDEALIKYLNSALNRNTDPTCNHTHECHCHHE